MISIVCGEVAAISPTLNLIRDFHDLTSAIPCGSEFRREIFPERTSRRRFRQD